MPLRRIILILPVLLAATSSAAVPPTPSGEPWVLVPAEWKMPAIQWRSTWDETFKTFDQGGQALTANPALKEAGGRILAMHRVEFLKALCEHFPQEEAKRIEAYKQIAEILRTLSDVWGRNYWYARLAEEFANRPDARAAGYNGVLEAASWYRQTPGWRVWWDYALKGIESLEPRKTPPNSAAWGAWIHMCQLRCNDMIEEGRFEQCRRYVLTAAAGATPETALGWWQNQLADLYKAAGHPLQAAEVWAKAGFPAQAEALRVAAAAAGAARGFVQDGPLESRWEVFFGGTGAGVRKGVTDVEGLQVTLDLCQQSEAVPVGGATPFVPFRVLITRAIAAMPADRLDALRGAQEAACRAALREAANSGEGDEVVRLFRRYPWAGNVHERLVAAAERQLQAGGYPWACRAFSDVLEYSADAGLRRQAQVGLWLSLAGWPDSRAALERAMAAVPDDELLPWRGGQARAQAVKKAIGPPDDNAGASALSALPRRRIELPPAAAWADTPSGNAFLDSATIGSWAIGQIAQADGRVYLAGPSVAACYAPGAEKLLWWRHSTGQAGAPATPNQWGSFGPGRAVWQNPGLHPGRRAPGLASDSSPAVAADSSGERRTFFTLVNDAPPPGPREAIVAFDAQSGLVRWSTAARDEWKGLRPLNAPAVAPGRVYALAVAAGGLEPNNTVMVRLSLVCLAADDGRMIWRKTLGTVAANSRLFTLAAGGMPVTLHGGWVYCSTDLGLAAKCDARDGAVEWIASYLSADQNTRAAVQFRREGASPLPAGDKIILAPRDHSGLIALDAATGKQLWETILIPSDRLAGRIGSTLLVRSLSELGGIDLENGRELWTLPLETPAPAQVCIRGGEAIVLAANTLRRITPAGAVAETLALTPPPGSEYALLADGSLLELASGPSPVPVSPEPAGPLALPLVKTWTLPLARPILLAPPEGPRDSFCVLSGRQVVRVRTQPAVGVLWQQSLATEPVAGVFAGGNLLLSDGSTLTALDLATGAIRWQTPMGFCITSFDGDGQVAVAVENFSDPNATVVDMASGKVLWHKIISEPVRFGDSLAQQVRVRREDGGRTIAFYYAGAFYGALTPRPSELTVEARTGALLGLRPCLGDETSWPRVIAFDTRGVHFLDSLGAPRSVALDGSATTFQSKRAVDMGPLNWSPAAVGIFPAPGGLYTKCLGELVYFDAATRREVVYSLPHNALTGRACVIYAVRELGDQLLVVSGLRGRSATYAAGGGAMFADLFDRATGAHVSGQELPGLACLDYPRTGYDTQAEIFDRTVVVTARDGVQVLSAAPAAAGARELTVDRSAAPAAADGRLGDWQEALQVPLSAPDGAAGTLRLAHDRRRLLLALTVPDGPAAPFRGRGTFSGGQCVEVALTSPAASGRWFIGVDSFGLPAARDADGETVADITAVRSVQAQAGTVAYEISLPLPASLWSSEESRHLRLGVRVARPGGAEALAWRGEAAGKAELMLPICLNPFTRAGEGAAKALTAAGGGAALAAAGLDRASAVPQAVAGKYLSQWVCIASGVRPTGLAVGLLADGQWRFASWHDPTPPQALPRPWGERARLAWWGGPIPAQGNWVELRVPLSALGVADRAIEGIVFRTESPGRVLWDRTVVVFPGGQRAIVEGAMPAGEPVGAWTWAADLSRVTVKAHEGPAVTIVDEAGLHGVILSAPFTEHAGTPARKAVLTQWVFLDPAQPPTAIAIQLSDGRRWSEPLLWGSPDAGVWVGPAPAAGAWAQLRVPLDRTGLAGEPITGIAFDQTDGRAIWGPTAVQIDGRTVEIITDKTPPMLARAGRRVWGPGPRRVVGGVEPVEGKGGLAARFDGRSGCLEIPDSPRLALTQFTVEGWVRLDAQAAGTQWIASKNEAVEGAIGFDLSVTDGRLRARVFGGPEGVATITSARVLVNAGMWHHVAMTWDGGALGAYVDGKAVEPAPVEPAPAKGLEPIGPVLAPTPPNRPGPTALYFARRSAGGWRLAVAPEEFHLRGDLGGLHVYARALSPAGVRAAAAPGKLPRSLRQAMIEDCTFEDLLAPGDPGTAWEWVQREGKAGHTLRAGIPGAVHAAIDLIEPVTVHLGGERAAIVAAVEKALPATGGGEELWRLFDWMRRAEGGPALARADRLRWFLRTSPDGPGAAQAQALLREALLDANAPADGAQPAADPPRRTADAFIREWLVAGSWQNDPATRSGFAQLLEPELHPIDMETRFAIVPAHVGQARWRVMRSRTNLIDLRGEASNDQQAVMLAACFAYTRQPRRVQFDVGCDDSMDVRVNRRLVHTLGSRPRFQPRDGSVEVVLPAGWSEIMLKIGQGPGPTFGFTFEARDGATGGPLDDVTFSTTPPQGLP